MARNGRLLKIPNAAISQLRLCSLGIAILCCPALAAEPLILRAGIEQIDLVPHLEYMMESGEHGTLDYALKNQSRFQSAENFNTSSSWEQNGVWFRVFVKNERHQNQKWIFNTIYRFKFLKFFVLRENGTILEREGGAEAKHNSQYARGEYSFDFDLAPGEAVQLYLFVWHDSLKFIAADLFTPESYQTHTVMIFLYYGIYFGLVIGLLTYNFFLATALRDRSYWYYIVYGTSVASYAFFLSPVIDLLPGGGPLVTFLRSNEVVFSDHFIALASSLSFTVTFLRLRQSHPRNAKVAAAISVFLVCCFPFMLFRSPVWAQLFSTRLFAPIELYTFALCLLGLQKGSRSARLFLLAWTIPVMWLVIISVPFFGPGIGIRINPRVLIQGTPVPFSIEMILLSLAVADRYRELREENENARENARSREMQLHALESDKRTLELTLLRRSIQPHFLMNSLNTTLGLIRENPASAEKLILALASEIRKILDLSQESMVNLDEELALCRAHLEVMGLRLEKQFQLASTGVIGNERLPPLIFLTLVENALSHQKAGCSDAVFSLSKLSDIGTDTFIFHAPGGEEEQSEKEGTGTRYIKSRLENAFPGGWQFSAAQRGSEFVTEIVILKKAGVV